MRPWANRIATVPRIGWPGWFAPGLWNGDEQAATDAQGPLVATREAVVVGGLEVPTEPMSGGGPEHEVEGDFTGEGICGDTGLAGMNPFGAKAEHKLKFFGDGPGLLEEKVGIPFGGMAGGGWSNTGLEFQPVLDWCHLNGDCGSEAGRCVVEVPGASPAQFQDCGGFCGGGGRLGTGVSTA